VLLLTGRADALDPSAATLVDGILKKPFDLDDLTAAVAAVLAGSVPGASPVTGPVRRA
jgi:hypothetical protein